jgi:hypothetical protein
MESQSPVDHAFNVALFQFQRHASHQEKYINPFELYKKKVKSTKSFRLTHSQKSHDTKIYYEAKSRESCFTNFLKYSKKYSL